MRRTSCDLGAASKACQSIKLGKAEIKQRPDWAILAKDAMVSLSPGNLVGRKANARGRAVEGTEDGVHLWAMTSSLSMG